MPENHPTHELLEQFMLGELSAAENRNVVRHLLSGCQDCRRVTSRYLPTSEGGIAPVHDSPWEDTSANRETQAFNRILSKLQAREASLAEERLAAPALLDELMSHPPTHRLLLARNSRRYQSWSLCELLLEKTRVSAIRNPGEGVELGSLGVAISECLDETAYGVTLVNDLRARAWTRLGNAHRVMSDLEAAEKALEHAEFFLADGTGDSLEEGRTLDIKAWLRSDQGRFQEAIRLEDKAIRAFKGIGDRHLAGQSLAHQATFCGYDGDLSRATTLLKRALELLDPAVDPRMVLATKHNLVLFLQEKGELTEALALLHEIRPLYDKLGSQMDAVRLKWVEAKLAEGLNQPQLAELSLLEARKCFVEHGIGLDAALVSLDLANLYLNLGRTEEVKRLATDMLPIFDSRDIHAEALAALGAFQQAAELEELSRELVEEISQYLESSRHNPKLPFRRG